MCHWTRTFWEIFIHTCGKKVGLKVPFRTVTAKSAGAIPEDQAVFGKWRALTQIYARKALHSQPAISASLKSTITEVLGNVLVTAGCTADPPTIREVLRSRF